MKKKRKDGRSQATRICDYLFLTVIILRDKVCFYCGIPAYTGHHIFQKANMHRHLRYDPVNALGICEKHHGPYHGVHAYPQQFEPSIKIAVDKIHGAGSYERLEARAYMTGSKADMKLVELILWQDAGEYGLFKPEGWDQWKEHKKINFLREVRRR